MLSLHCKRTVAGMFYVHNFHHLHLYSTKSPNQTINFPDHKYLVLSTRTKLRSPNQTIKPPNQTIKPPIQTITNYLVNNLGFSQKEAHSTRTKLRSKNDSYSRFCNNANSVVDFLKQYGFNDTRLKKVISCYPRILTCKVDETLKPKFKLFQEHGISGSNLVSVISANPSLVAKNLDPTILDLKAVLGSDENLTKFFSKSNMFAVSGVENLVSNVALLNKEYGVDIHVIRNYILQQPSCFFRKPEFFRNLLVRVEEELRIPRISGMFFYGIQLLSSCSKECIEAKCQALRSFGWTENDISKLVRRNPSAFRKSEENIKKKLGFLMTELGYDPGFLASNAALFNYSLEKRMLPRHGVLLILKEKGLLDYNFYVAITKTEPKFLKRFIEPYKEAVPGLLQVYQNSLPE